MMHSFLDTPISDRPWATEDVIRGWLAILEAPQAPLAPSPPRASRMPPPPPPPVFRDSVHESGQGSGCGTQEDAHQDDMTQGDVPREDAPPYTQETQD